MLWLALRITQNVVASSLSNRQSLKKASRARLPQSPLLLGSVQFRLQFFRLLQTLGIEKAPHPFIIAP
jgi:hypothetical protein